ncbi:MAG: phosphotransferase family protein [Chloroflexota bacterium]
MDPFEVLRALGIEGAESATPVAGGWDTALWKIGWGGRSFALRVFRAGQEATCLGEIRAMRLATDGGIPVPAIHAVGAWNERPALLLSWCAGRPLVEALRERPDRAWDLGIELGRMQARIHQVRVPAAAGEEPERWIDWAGPNQGALRARLRSVARSQDRLLHLDFHPLNVLFDAGRVTGIIDWANARVGDPRADLARTYTILRVLPLPDDAQSILTPRVRAGLARAWRDGYRQAAGPVGDLELFLAWAGVVMLRDLAPRLGQPGVWLRSDHFDRIARWMARWKRRAGIPGD